MSRKSFLAGIGLAMLVLTSQASHAIVIGNAATDRSISDGWSNFVLGLTTEVFTDSGTVTSWEVYANNPGTLGMLILRNSGGNNYDVVGADFETATAGLNNYIFSADTGVANVLAGDILGLYIGTSKIDFELGGTDSVSWCGNSGCINNLNQLNAGASLTLNGSGSRIYSANATLSTVPVSEPATLILMGLGLAGLTFFRRKKVITLPSRERLGSC